MKPLKMVLAAAAIALAPVASAQTTQLPSNPGNWNLTIEEGEVSHTIGNPAAETVLAEYISYTCPTCAKFAREGDPPLELVYVGSGKVRLEIKHIVRDPIDLTIAMMTHCGEARKFKQNHAAFMLSQPKWIGKLQRQSEAQITRWTQPGAGSRRNIANDFGFYEIMKQRGYRITDVDKCLNDQAKAQKFAEANVAYAQEYGNHGTPMFTINGRRVANVVTWQGLQPNLDAATSQNGQ